MICVKPIGRMGIILALWALAGICACDSSADEISSVTPSGASMSTYESLSPSPSNPQSETGTLLPSASPSPTPAVSLVLSGPATAHAGDDLTYRLNFSAPAGIHIRINWSPMLTYMNSEAVDGASATLISLATSEPYGSWDLRGSGALDVVLRVPSDAEPSSAVRVGCYEPGTNSSYCPEPVDTTIG